MSRTPPADAPRPRQRQRRAPFYDHVLYSRWPGKGNKLQLRWWLRGYGNINLGMYEREIVPVVKRKVAARTRHHANDPIGIWAAVTEVLNELRHIGVEGLPDPLPLYVKRCADGCFCAWVRKGGQKIELPGPFETPEEAYRAMVAHLAREFPRWNRTKGRAVSNTSEDLT